MIPATLDLNCITGKVFVLGDNIDTDQIIPAHFLNLVPTKPDEYRQLGSHALAGLPADLPPYMQQGAFDTEFPVILARKNFGSGSSREHAPISLGAAGCRVVLAESFARIFFRNTVATGELFPLEYKADELDYSCFKTGDEVRVDMNALTLTHLPSGRVFPIKNPGDVREVICAGGIFEFARRNGNMQ